MSNTLRELVDAVLTRLAMGQGEDVQIYAEDRIVAALQHKFDVLFDDYWWPQYTVEEEQFTLDGTTGMITGTLAAKCTRHKDLYHVIHESGNAPLPRHPKSLRSNAAFFRKGIRYTNVAGKIFQVIPLTTTGNVYVSYRTYVAPVNDEDIILLDKQLMVLGTCHDILEDDGTNPDASTKFKEMYRARLKQETANLNNIQPATGDGIGNFSYPDRWS